MKSIAVFCLCLIFLLASLISCQTTVNDNKTEAVIATPEPEFVTIDTAAIPKDKFGEAVRYGYELMVNTAYYIGPKGINGKYLGSRTNCTNCHQDAGTKPFSFNLMKTHEDYPQYRAREGKILSLTERVNNCVMRPHNGKPLPPGGKEMNAFLSYFKWINSYVNRREKVEGIKNLSLEYPAVAADPVRGGVLYAENCARCHGTNGEGIMQPGGIAYTYPPLWGPEGYQPGSSMHRVIKQAQWLKANMPFDKATWNKPYLTDQQALDIAAFVNNDKIHDRPNPVTFDYPYPEEKAIDYDKPPFADTFSVSQHKYGPYKPIIEYLKNKGARVNY